MVTQTKKIIQKPKEETFTVNFSKGALESLKSLASYYAIPPDQLGTIVLKGIQVLNAVKNAKEDKIVIETNKERQVLHLKKT